MGALPLRSKGEFIRPKRPAWYKAKEKELNAYKADLDRRLQGLQMPECLHCMNIECNNVRHTTERDNYMLDLMGAVIEASHANIPLVGGKQGSPNKRSGCMPGWNDTVKPLKEASLLWHSIWMSAGRPITGQLFETMKFTRNKYKHAVRKLKQEVDNIKANKLFEASLWGGGDLLDELKKTRGGKSNPDLPENVAGGNGEEEVCEEFKKVYSRLYNSAPTVVEDIEPDKSELAEVEKVTGLVVKMAVSGLKKGRHDVSGSYGTDAIKAAPDAFFDCLAKVFKSWMVHGTVSRPLLACAFLPLLKNSLKDPADVKSYRAIAGSAVVLMLFDRIILNLWGDRMKSGSLQMGYKANSSTAQCTYMVNEVINHFLREGTNPILIALDMSMAFDKCRFDVLFKRAAERLPRVVVRALIFVYKEQFAWVRWGNAKSTIFGIANGTRQGSVLSPALFSLYVQELLDRLKALGVGCHVGEVFVGAVAWADDFLLTAPSHAAAKIMLDTASSFAAEVGLEFSTDANPAKSKSKAIFVVGRNRGLPKPEGLMLSGKVLPWVQKAAHLGHELNESGSMDPDVRMRRGALIGRCLEVQEAFGFAGPSEVLGAIKLYCGDLYGGMLSRLDSDAVKQLTNCWFIAVKEVWGLPRSTHTANARYLSRGFSSLKEDLLTRWPKFFRSLLTGPSPEVAAVAEMAAMDARSTTAANNRIIFGLTGQKALVATAAQVRRALRANEKLTEQELDTAIELEKALQDRWYLKNASLDYDAVQHRIMEIC
jgi:hypothetical protein